MHFSVIDHNPNHSGPRRASIYVSLFHKPFNKHSKEVRHVNSVTTVVS